MPTVIRIQIPTEMFDFVVPVFTVWALLGPVLGAEYSITRGGTKLFHVPEEILIVISPNFHVYDNEPDCVGVYIGGFDPERDQDIALTSPYCEIRSYPEVRTARQQLLSARQIYYGSDEFQIGMIQLEFVRHDWKPPRAKIVQDKNEYRKEIEKANKERKLIGYGFAANTNPLLVYTVSFNQTNCARLFKEFRKSSWPYELPEGTFCVFQGQAEGFPKQLPFNNVPVFPATPCYDAMGSPVLYETTLQRTTATTTTTTISPPPLPRIPPTSGPCADVVSLVTSCCPRLSSIVILCGFCGIWR